LFSADKKTKQYRLVKVFGTTHTELLVEESGFTLTDDRGTGRAFYYTGLKGTGVSVATHTAAT
jgi:hypothetical protein